MPAGNAGLTSQKAMIRSAWTGGCRKRIYAYFAVGTYADWESVVKPIVEADPNKCPVLDDVGPNAWENIDQRRRPIQRVTFIAPKEADALELLEGTVIRFYTSPEPADVPILSAPASGHRAVRAAADAVVECAVRVEREI